jgi:hypothetical protein
MIESILDLIVEKSPPLRRAVTQLRSYKTKRAPYQVLLTQIALAAILSGDFTPSEVEQIRTLLTTDSNTQPVKYLDVRFRVSSQEKEVIVKAAKAANMTLSEYLRSKVF